MTVDDQRRNKGISIISTKEFRQDLHVYLSRVSFGSKVVIRLGDGQELVLSKNS